MPAVSTTDPVSTEPVKESVSEFTTLGLPKPLVAGLSRQGIDAPFPIQQAAIPDILAGHDVLGRGQTGSGKTLAFGLPMMTRISGKKAQPKRPHAIILVPTRELALQVNDALEPLGRGLGLKMKTVVGGMSMGKQIDALRRGVDVVVATPGRLTDLIEQGECILDDVQVAILDEADHMCDLGFFPVVSAILDLTPHDGQRLLFSATLDGDVDKLVRRFLTNPVTHSLSPANSSVDTMEHHIVQVTWNDKADVTAEIAAREGRTIMFVRTQHGVDRVVKQLARVGVKAGGLHGGKRQNQRTRILAEFREGNILVLVCTDVAARGIHVDDVSLVLHIDPPADHKSYLHRGGRTARAGEKGSVLTLIMPNERRATDALTRRANINPTRHKVAPGDPILAEIAGARQPSGVSIPVWEPDTRKPLRTRGGSDRPSSGGGRPRRSGEGFRSREDRAPRGDRGDRGYPRRDDRFGGAPRADSAPREGGYNAPRDGGFNGRRDERPVSDRAQESRARQDRPYSSDRPAGGDRRRDERPYRDDRAPRTFGEDRGGSRPYGDRPQRSFGAARPAREGERPFRPAADNRDRAPERPAFRADERRGTGSDQRGGLRAPRQGGTGFRTNDRTGSGYNGR